jgi:hypothetical protein
VNPKGSFKPGVSGNPKGRPVGSKDQKWKSAQAIWDLLQAEWANLTPNQRAGYAMDVFKMHFERAIAQLPKDSNDSLTSANKLMDELKQLEAETLERFTNKGRMANGTSEVQTKPPAKGS